MLLFCALIAPSFASSPHHRDHMDAWVRLDRIEDKALIKELGLGFVESQDGDWWRVHGEADSEPRLKRSGLEYRHARSPLWAEGAHHSPDEMIAALRELAEAHPESAEYVDLGTSFSGRPIAGLRLGRATHPIHRMRILGAHHGDETSSAEVTLNAAETLLSGDEHAAFLDSNEVWVVPHVNPDGIAALSRYSDNNVDLNRNYGFEWSATSFRSGDGPFSEPETQAIRTLGSWVDFGLGLSVHSGEINLGWVWNYTIERTPDEELLAYLASAYAEDCTTTDFWTTNGADWYVTNGDTTDWSYGRHGTLDYTLEVSRNKNPGISRMAEIKAEHVDAIPSIFSWPWWIAGSIHDAESGVPVMATLTIEELGFQLTAGHDGHFSRPVQDGIWTLSVSSPGYLDTVVDVDASGIPTEVSLERAEVSAVWPTSRWVSSAGSFGLDDDAESVILARPGHQDVVATPSEDHWAVDMTSLSPGPWTAIVDGYPAPNSLFVSDWGGDAAVETVEVTDGQIFIELPGLGQGTRVWAMWGDWRNPVPVPIIEDLFDLLVLDGSELPLAEQPVDLLIWTRGLQLGVVDIHSSEPDEGPDEPPPEDTGRDTADPSDEDEPQDQEPPADMSDGIVGGDGKLAPGGCASLPHHYRAWVWLVSLLGLLLRRRP